MKDNALSNMKDTWTWLNPHELGLLVAEEMKALDMPIFYVMTQMGEDWEQLSVPMSLESAKEYATHWPNSSIFRKVL